ncbi:MAG: hypothetical protein V4634_03770 [Pseudomonadota bacterium]
MFIKRLYIIFKKSIIQLKSAMLWYFHNVGCGFDALHTGWIAAWEKLMEMKCRGAKVATIIWGAMLSRNILYLAVNAWQYWLGGMR